MCVCLLVCLYITSWLVRLLRHKGNIALRLLLNTPFWKPPLVHVLASLQKLQNRKLPNTAAPQLWALGWADNMIKMACISRRRWRLLWMHSEASDKEAKAPHFVAQWPSIPFKRFNHVLVLVLLKTVTWFPFCYWNIDIKMWGWIYILIHVFFLH